MSTDSKDTTNSESIFSSGKPKPYLEDYQRILRSVQRDLPWEDNQKRKIEEDAEAQVYAESIKPFCFQMPIPDTLVDVPNYMAKVRAYFWYEERTGELYHTFNGGAPVPATRRIGDAGYGRTTLWGMATSSANVVFLLHRERWPIGRLRRRDGDPRNDRIGNLYELRHEPVTASRGLSRPGRAPSRGVARCGPRHWQAYVKVNGVQKNLGRFDTEEEALQARADWDAGADLV